MKTPKFVWRWNDMDPGECHLLAVAKAWEDHLVYPGMFWRVIDQG